MIDQPCPLKVMIIGSQQTGKSTLIQKLTNQSTNPSQYIQSISISQTIIDLTPSHPFRINIYDTPGAKDYSMLIRNVITRFQYLIMCYDGNNLQSLIDLEQFWIQDIMQSLDLEQVNVLLLCINRTNHHHDISSQVQQLCSKYRIKDYMSIDLDNEQDIKKLAHYYVQLQCSDIGQKQSNQKIKDYKQADYLIRQGRWAYTYHKDTNTDTDGDEYVKGQNMVGRLIKWVQNKVKNIVDKLRLKDK